VVSKAFLSLAQTERAMRGLSDLPLIEVPHPVGTLSADALGAIAASSVDPIVSALTVARRETTQVATNIRIEQTAEAALWAPRDASQFFDFVTARGWSDGLPVLPPTPEAVDAMMAASALSAATVLGTMPPLNGITTVEKIAANAVMSGCLPEYFSVVVAAVKGMLNEGFNLDGVQTTTGNVAPLTIINGPCRRRLDVNCSSNALGQGWRANATIGRAIRLCLTNIGGAVPGLYDKSTLGQPAKYTFCIGENEEQNPWEPLHAERGFPARSDAVSIFGCSGVNSAVDMASQTADGLLKTFALTMMGGLTSGVTSTEVMLILCPEHAAILAAGGFSKSDIRQSLCERARVPYEKISNENLELLSKRRPLWFRSDANSIVGAVDDPEDIWVMVAGGSGAKSAYIPGRTGTHLQTIKID
jgi:hypothetical protein